ncbi:Crp/Fnr family transcriptional regulator [Gynurincola endophyticus]|uniref:Crp/Fnr family transcriptional regulator n=1 Tax=Gynurincola endophyticus TaxID=2479004 RepID=UPI000F8D7F7D|nr:Crp/Fnr family transcriptional regulator [Gynurincola endophyticus]
MVSNTEAPIPPSQKESIGNFSFTQILQRIHPLSDEVKSYLDRHISQKQFKKNEVIHEAGNICENIYYIKRGVLRGFYLYNNKEITTWFSRENQLAACISTFNNENPTKESIQVIEDAEVYVIDYNVLQEMYNRFPEFNYIVRMLYQEYLMEAEDRAFVARLTEASLKYDYFVQTNGLLLRRIPLKYIASYLGMTLETLSRIRNKYTQKKQ